MARGGTRSAKNRNLIGIPSWELPGKEHHRQAPMVTHAAAGGSTYGTTKFMRPHI